MGIILATTTTYILDSNGPREGTDRSFKNKIRALIKAANLPQQHCENVLKHAVYLHERTVTSYLHMRAPYEVLLRATPNHSFIKTFTFAAYMHVHKHNLSTKFVQSG